MANFFRVAPWLWQKGNSSMVVSAEPAGVFLQFGAIVAIEAVDG